MSESEQGGGHKVGIVAGLLAVLGGIGKFADDCGRGAARVGGAATHVGDDAVRGAGRLGGVGDDVGRAGVGLGDDALHAGKVPIALEAGSPVRLGEGALAKVADDAAPGAGRSVEEALADSGVDLSLEVVSWELPDEGEDLPSRMAEPAPAPIVLSGAEVRTGTFGATPGRMVVVVAKTDEKGMIPWGDQQVSDNWIHSECALREARCAVVTCAHDAPAGCVSTATNIGRTSAARVSKTGTPSARYAELVYALLDQRSKTQSADVAISRVDVRGDKIVRTRLGSATRRPSDRAQ